MYLISGYFLLGHDRRNTVKAGGNGASNYVHTSNFIKHLKPTPLVPLQTAVLFLLVSMTAPFT